MKSGTILHKSFKKPTNILAILLDKNTTPEPIDILKTVIFPCNGRIYSVHSSIGDLIESLKIEVSVWEPIDLIEHKNVPQLLWEDMLGEEFEKYFFRSD